jgi:hypothetical protein
MIIYTAGGVSTAIYCKGLLDQYNSKITQYNVNILFNTSINLPDARLCFDLSNGPLFYYTNSSDIEKEMVLTNQLEIYFNKTANRKVFLDQPWPKVMSFTAFLYASRLTAYETYLYNGVAQYLDNIYDDSTFIYPIDPGNDCGGE